MARRIVSNCAESSLSLSLSLSLSSSFSSDVFSRDENSINREAGCSEDNGIALGRKNFLGNMFDRLQSKRRKFN